MSISKRLLVIGLLNLPKGSQASAASSENIRDSVQAEFRKTKEAGYDLDISLCDDEDFDNALRVSVSETI